MLHFIYYAGHGIQDNTCHAVLNEKEDSKVLYPLEYKVRDLVKKTFENQLYVFTVFDCCR